MRNTAVLLNLLVYWGLEVSAFVLLPLLIYLIVYSALGISFDQIEKLPEWMFISIILFGDTTRKTILYYKSFHGFDLKAIRIISLGVLGIVVSSVLLVFTLLAQIREGFSLSPSFYFLQSNVFLFSILMSAFMNVWISWSKGEGELLAFMYTTEDKDTKSK